MGEVNPIGGPPSGPDLLPGYLYLADRYTFTSPEVESFLRRQPFLVPLLFEAHGRIEQSFGSDPDVRLEVVADPEAVDHHELVAFIRTDLSPTEALDRLDRFDDEWWLEASRRGRGKLCITLGYR